jgi:hypothetical protein
MLLLLYKPQILGQTLVYGSCILTHVSLPGCVFVWGMPLASSMLGPPTPCLLRPAHAASFVLESVVPDTGAACYIVCTQVLMVLLQH